MSFAKAMLVVAVIFLSNSPCQAADWVFATQILPPFTYEEDGRAAGPMVDIVREVCAAIDNRCDIVVVPLRRGQHGLDSGEYDGMFPLLATTERLKIYFMAQPIIATSYSFVASKNSAWNYAGPRSLDGKTIGVFGPSGALTTLEKLVKEDTSARVEIELSNDIVLHKLAGGRYGQDGVAFVNRDVALALFKQQGIADLRLVGDGPEALYTIALSKEKVPKAMAERLDETLSILKASGRIKEILVKYHMQEATPQQTDRN